MQRVGQVIGRLDLKSSPGSEGGSSGLTGVWVFFVCLFQLLQRAWGAGQIPFSRGLGLPT